MCVEKLLASSIDQVDFCERPIVPTSLKPGVSPLAHSNWGAWGLQFMSTCSVFWAYTGTVPASMALPAGWGIKRFPCTKLSPLDCFREGGSFDYPEEMQLLERRVPDTQGVTNLTLIDLILGLYQMENVPVKCVNLLRANVTSQFRAAGRDVAQVEPVQNLLLYSIMDSPFQKLEHNSSIISCRSHELITNLLAF